MSIKNMSDLTSLFSRWENGYTEEKLFIKVTQGVGAKHRLSPDLVTPILFSYSYTSMDQLSEVVRNNNGSQEDLKLAGVGSPFSEHYGLLRVYRIHEREGKIWTKLLGFVDGWGELPWGHVDVLEEANKPVHQGHAQRTEDGVPVGLHVLRGTPLGITLTAKIISAGCHDVWDEIIISTRCLEK